MASSRCAGDGPGRSRPRRRIAARAGRSGRNPRGPRLSSNRLIEYFGGLQQRGEIEAFGPVALEPHGGDLYGFLLLRGDPDSLARVRASEEFRRLIQRAGLTVEDVGVVTAFVGDDVTRLFATFRQQAGELTR